MDEPCSVLELGEGVVEKLGVDTFFDFIYFLHDHVPLGGEDV